ncbi:hypothetical protein ABPG74_017002 [Tetrahymena malaccensis]
MDIVGISASEYSYEEEQSNFSNFDNQNFQQIISNLRINQLEENFDQDGINLDQKLPRIQTDDIINKEEIKIFLDEIICPICYYIIDDAKTCNKCEANFCDNCIQKWTQNSTNKCPCCRDQGQNTYLNSRNGINDSQLISMIQFQRRKYSDCPRIFKKLLSSVQIVCHYPQCKTIFNLDQRMNHLQVCMYHPKKCQNDNCQEMVSAIEKEDHNKICEYRKEPCTYCRQPFPIKQMLNHEDICPEHKFECLKCNQQYQIQNQEQHKLDCPNKKVKCMICYKKFMHKDFLEHTELICYQQLYQYSLEKNAKQEQQLQLQDKLINNLIQDLKDKLEYPENSINKQDILECLNEYSQKKKQNQLHQQYFNQEFLSGSSDLTIRKNKRKKNQDYSEESFISNNSEYSSIDIPGLSLNEQEQNNISEDFFQQLDSTICKRKQSPKIAIDKQLNSKIESFEEQEEQKNNIDYPFLVDYDRYLQQLESKEKMITQLDQKYEQTEKNIEEIQQSSIPISNQPDNYFDSYFEMQDLLQIRNQKQY